MKQTVIYILVCVLLCSIALNVFQAVKKPESLDAGTVAPTTQASETTSPAEEKLTYDELSELAVFIEHISGYLRRDSVVGTVNGYWQELFEGTKKNRKNIADLIDSLAGARVLRAEQVIEIDIMEPTDEKIETFLSIFGNDEYFVFSDKMRQGGPSSSIGTMNTKPTE